MKNKMLELLALCMKVNEQTDADVFFSYSGHVNSINVWAFVDGYKDGKHADYDEYLYIAKDFGPLVTIDDMVEYLKGLL